MSIRWFGSNEIRSYDNVDKINKLQYFIIWLHYSAGLSFQRSIYHSCPGIGLLISWVTFRLFERIDYINCRICNRYHMEIFVIGVISAFCFFFFFIKWKRITNSYACFIGVYACCLITSTESNRCWLTRQVNGFRASNKQTVKKRCTQTVTNFFFVSPFVSFLWVGEWVVVDIDQHWWCIH